MFAGSGLSFGAIRYWMGLTECGNFSGGVKTVTRLFPRKERTLAIGIFNSGSMVGATIATPLIVFLMQHYGFRTAFLAPASLGFIWVAVWWFVYRREPKPAREGDIKQESLRTMLGQSSSWAVMMCRFFIGPVIQFYWYWIPSYLYSVRHMTLTQIGIIGWLPFLLGDIGGVMGGGAAGFLQRRGVPILRVRQITMYGSALICIASFFVPYTNSASIALTLIGIAMLADNFLSANMYGAITDLFPDHQVGRATGLTGVASGLSGLLFPLLTGRLVDKVSYTPVFVMVAIMPLLGTIALFALGRKYRRNRDLTISRLDI
jgi:ACS family hexuronate transporter-like MFS transporter